MLLSLVKRGFLSQRRLEVVWMCESKTVQAAFLRTILSTLRWIGVDVYRTLRPASSLPYIIAGRSCIAVTDAVVEYELTRNPSSLKAVTILLGNESFAALVLKKYLVRDVNRILQDYLSACIAAEDWQGSSIAYVPNSPLSKTVLEQALESNLIQLPEGVYLRLVPLWFETDPKSFLKAILRVIYTIYLVSGYLFVLFLGRRFRMSYPKQQKYKVAIQNVWGVDPSFHEHSKLPQTFPHDLFFVIHEE